MPLGFGEPFSIATIAFQHTVSVAPIEKVRISTRTGHRIKGLKSSSRPLAMPFLLERVRSIGERGADLDEQMVEAPVAPLFRAECPWIGADMSSSISKLLAHGDEVVACVATTSRLFITDRGGCVVFGAGADIRLGSTQRN